MKKTTTHMRLLIIACCFLTSLNIWANDTIRFDRIEGKMRNGFSFRSTAGLSINWGDGNIIDIPDNIGPLSYFACSHEYKDSNKYTITIYGRNEDAFVTYLDLRTVGGIFSNLDISNADHLIYLACGGNAFSLADLYNASLKIKDSSKAIFHEQTLPIQKCALNQTILITPDSVLGGINTAYSNIKRNGNTAIEGTDYTLTGNHIAFKTAGIYTIEMRNAAIRSYSPVVVASYRAGVNADATLQSLTVNVEGITLSFNPNVTSYIVAELRYIDSVVTITGVASDNLANVTGNITDTTLAVGDNIIQITVTAEDGVTQKTYTINVIRSGLTGIKNPENLISNIAIFPNPTNGKLKIETEVYKFEKVQILDMAGKLVFESQQSAFDITHLPNGIYSAKIITDKDIIIKKIVKQ